MKRKLLLLSSFLFSLSLNPMIVSAEENTAETTESTSSNSIAAIIALLVFIVVTYSVYKSMYAGTTIIGTRNGIAYEKGRMLFIPSMIGLIVAGIVYKVVDFLSGLLVIIGIIAAIVVIAKIITSKSKGSSS